MNGEKNADRLRTRRHQVQKIHPMMMMLILRCHLLALSGDIENTEHRNVFVQ